MLTGHKFTIKNPFGSYFVTLTVVGWVDVFTRDRYNRIIIDALRHCIHSKGLNVYAYCIMSNHIHLVINSDIPEKLDAIVRDFKKFTSKQIVRSIQEDVESRREWMLAIFKQAEAEHCKKPAFKFWQDGNHPIELYNERFTWIKVMYIHRNPVKAGLVHSPEEWRYSSARNYHELDNVLPEVIPLTAPVNFCI